MIDCADGFSIEIQKLAQHQPENISRPLRKMIDDVDRSKTCLLQVFSNIDCLKEALRIYGIQQFDKLLAISGGRLHELFLKLRSLDIETINELMKLRNGNLLDYLKSISLICNLFIRKAALVRAYNASLTS